jgi:hypothetical protein
MDAADIMPRDVLSINPDASMSNAAQVMLSNRISGLSVIEIKAICRHRGRSFPACGARHNTRPGSGCDDP